MPRCAKGLLKFWQAENVHRLYSYGNCILLFAMPTIPANNSEKHFKYLDSARGIAALMVFGSHFIARTFQEKMNVHYFFFVFNGNDAVSFFFVLSGFVLSYKYVVIGKPLDIKQFYVSRVFRLFPAYFLIVLWSALYAYRTELSLQTIKDLFIFNKYEFWEEAFLLHFHNKFYYPGWTLTLEMVGSFLMPFYIALAIKNKRLIPWFIVAMLIVGNNLCFSYMFAFGIVASCYYYEIIGISFGETKWFKYRYPILLASFVLFSIRQIDAVSPLGPSYKYLAGFLGIDFFTYTGIACFVFLVAILHSKGAQRFLENKVLVYMGKISYGVYLVHVVVINTVFLYTEQYLSGPYPTRSFVLITLLVIAAVVLVATVLHYFVELPFMRLGKRITSRIKPSLVIGRNVD